MTSFVTYIIECAVRVYQRTISPSHGILRAYFRARGVGCRYVPSCSEYFIESVHTHGIARGMFRGARRIIRCHPWAEGGYDPVVELLPASPNVASSDSRSFTTGYDPVSEQK